MIKLILGKKGSGKSKQIVEMANKLVTEDKGDIVFIDDDKRYMYDLKHEIRFVNITEYDIDDTSKFYGFVCGMLSQDFDITHIFIDGIKNMLHKSLIEMEPLFNSLNAILRKNNVKAIIVMSVEPENVPDYVKQYID